MRAEQWPQATCKGSREQGMRAATGSESKKKARSSLDHHSYLLSMGEFCMQRIFWGGNLKCLVWEMGQANCSGLLSSEKTGRPLGD